MDIQFEYNKELDKIIFEALVSKMKKSFNSNISKIQNYLSYRIAEIFRQTPEYTSLISGDLMAQFGLVADRAESLVNKIIKTFANQIEIEFADFGFGAGIYIYAIRSNFEEILSLPEAQYTSNGHLIPWLQWFLIEGDRVLLVHNFHIVFGNFTNARSGKALMKVGGSWGSDDWKVGNINYTGVISDNWITYTVDILFRTSFEKAIKEAIKVGLGV